MSDPNLYLFIASTALAAIAMLTFAGLAGFRGWLSLKQQQLAMTANDYAASPVASAGARIELADLKERIRKLEAIAAGVDL